MPERIAEQLMAMDDKRMQGKRAGMVVLSSYPHDPRPRRAADALVQLGMNVDYVCLADGKAPWHEKTNGIDVFRVPIARRRGGKFSYAYEYSAFILASAAILAARSLRHRYDLVYINNMPDILVAGALLPKLLGAKVILDMHDPMPELMTTIFRMDPGSKSVRLIKWLEKWSMARADQVLTVNIACQRIFATRSCPPEKIAVVMNAPDGEIFPFHAARSQSVANHNGDRRFVVMYHGSLVERNGVDLAVEALAQVRQKLPMAQLHVYGKKTAFLETVMQSVRERGLEQNVLYLGQKPLEEIAHAIAACDVGVIPNHRNAFTDINTPTRIFEYLAMGKPVIAPSTPGILDYFTEDSLLLVEPGNSADIARQIEYVASNYEDAIRVAERGQQIYLQHIWKQERRTLAELVGGLLSRGEAYDRKAILQ